MFCKQAILCNIYCHLVFEILIEYYFTQRKLLTCPDDIYRSRNSPGVPRQCTLRALRHGPSRL